MRGRQAGAPGGGRAHGWGGRARASGCLSSETAPSRRACRLCSLSADPRSRASSAAGRVHRHAQQQRDARLQGAFRPPRVSLPYLLPAARARGSSAADSPPSRIQAEAELHSRVAKSTSVKVRRPGACSLLPGLCVVVGTSAPDWRRPRHARASARALAPRGRCPHPPGALIRAAGRCDERGTPLTRPALSLLPPGCRRAPDH